MPSIHLVKAREKTLLRRHPWIFSGAIEKVSDAPSAGETVDIFANDGRWLAKAAYSPESQIRARVWTFDKKEHINFDFFHQKIATAYAIRQSTIDLENTTGIRIVASEADGLPGITIDKYNDYLVCQLLTAGAEFHKKTIVEALKTQFPDCHIYERSDVAVRQKEGLKKQSGILHGIAPSELICIKENGLKILVDIEKGHKTGFYLDQRDSRLKSMDYVKDKEVLNCFCYTGAFGLYALQGKAKRVINVDVSQRALDTAKKNAEINGFSTDKKTAVFLNSDVFNLLREYRDQGTKFDTIIMDPPKFIDNKQQLISGCRGYKDINMLAMQLLTPGGTLLTYSCSGLIDSQLFQKIIADAAIDANKEVKIIEKFTQAKDHLIDSSFPEGFYLKGLACRIIN